MFRESPVNNEHKPFHSEPGNANGGTEHSLHEGKAKHGET